MIVIQPVSSPGIQRAPNALNDKAIFAAAGTGNIYLVGKSNLAQIRGFGNGTDSFAIKYIDFTSHFVAVSQGNKYKALYTDTASINIV